MAATLVPLGGTRTMERDETIIVGGGIGGLSAALMLSRAGLRVRVLEQADEFAEIGAGLQLAPNATRLLHRHGLLDDLLDTAVQPRQLLAMNALSGQKLTALDLEQVRSRYGAPYIVMHRHDLLEVLVRHCRKEPSLALETAKQVTTVEDVGDHVVVACEDGSTYRSEVLIGADGLSSTVRPLVVGGRRAAAHRLRGLPRRRPAGDGGTPFRPGRSGRLDRARHALRAVPTAPW